MTMSMNFAKFSMDLHFETSFYSCEISFKVDPESEFKAPPENSLNETSINLSA